MCPGLFCVQDYFVNSPPAAGCERTPFAIKRTLTFVVGKLFSLFPKQIYLWGPGGIVLCQRAEPRFRRVVPPCK